MPVLSEPVTGTNIQDLQNTYFFLGVLFLFFLGVYMSRNSRASNASATSSPPVSEKIPCTDEGQSSPIVTPISQMPRPPQPPPLIPPTLYEGRGGEAQIYYSPTEISGTFGSFEPAEEVTIPPRRRSYTKVTAGGNEVSGEIIEAEGWRRHTRVFGGGVCLACVESERRMTA